MAHVLSTYCSRIWKKTLRHRTFKYQGTGEDTCNYSVHVHNANPKFRGMVHMMVQTLLLLSLQPTVFLSTPLFIYCMWVTCLSLDLPAPCLSNLRRNKKDYGPDESWGIGWRIFVCL